jgi:cell division protein FtsZ
MRLAEAGITELQKSVDTLIVIPNQNLFRVANEKTTFADAFAMADQVLYSGVACITDLMVKEGLINLDFADVRAIMRGMGKAMMGTGEASGENRAMAAAEAAIANPLLDDVSMRGARGLLISITGGPDLTLYEVDEAATRIREEVDCEANIILGATFDEGLEGVIRVSVVATGIDFDALAESSEVTATEQRIAEVAERLRAEARARAAQAAAQRSLVEPTRQAAPVSVTVQAPAPVAAAPAPVAEAAPAPVQAEIVAEAPAPVEMRPAAPQPAPRSVIPDMTAAIAEAVRAPMQAAPAPAPAPAPVSYDEPAQDAPFMPPQAERVARQPRMPRIDELPVPAQNQIRAQRDGEGEQKRVGLLQRLATVGFGRREEHAAAPVQAPRPAPAPQAHAPQPQAPAPQQQHQPAPEPVQQRPAMSPVHAEYAKRPVAPPQASRPAQGNLDPHGRAPAPNRLLDDDQLEIPAFLRRQAN